MCSAFNLFFKKKAKNRRLTFFLAKTDSGIFFSDLKIYLYAKNLRNLMSEFGEN